MEVRVFKVYIDGGNDSIFTVVVPAKTEEEAIHYCSGNGEVVSVKDITNSISLDVDFLSRILSENGYNNSEVQVITRLVELCGFGS